MFYFSLLWIKLNTIFFISMRRWWAKTEIGCECAVGSSLRLFYIHCHEDWFTSWWDCFSFFIIAWALLISGNSDGPRALIDFPMNPPQSPFQLNVAFFLTASLVVHILLNTMTGFHHFLARFFVFPSISGDCIIRVFVLTFSTLRSRKHWVLPGFTEFYWVLLSFTRFYWVLLGFTGFYLVSIGFTGFYWVLLGFTGFQ